MADPNFLETLRKVKVAEAMVNSRAFVEHLIAEAELDTPTQTQQEAIERIKRMMALMTASHVELINAFGALDEQLRGRR